MNTTGKKFGGRTKGTPNKLSTEIKESLSLLISEAVSSLDINAMSKSEKLKLIQLGLLYRYKGSNRRGSRRAEVYRRNYRQTNKIFR